MKLTQNELRARAKEPREALSIDRLAVRVDLVCSCNNDIAYGYGETVDLARQLAAFCFRRDHGARAKWRTEMVQKAVEHGGGGWHYEEVSS